MTVVANPCPVCGRRTAQEIYEACQRDDEFPWVYSTKLCLSCGNFIDMITSWEKTPQPERVRPLRHNCPFFPANRKF